MIEARPPRADDHGSCTGCGGAKGAPIAGVVTLGPPAELHPVLRIALDAEAQGRAKEAGQIMCALAEGSEPAYVSRSVQIVLCEECGRDAANAIGFLCLRDGGWSKLEPRKRRAAR
jgi:hypothetical protein